MYPKWKGKWAVVTGASSGGAEIARQLAAAGVICSVARREERMRELGSELEERNGVKFAQSY